MTIYLTPMNYKIYHPTKIVNCEIDLPSSKSISNRLLIIQSLCKDDFKINNLSNSDDTCSLQLALQKNSGTINVGAGGTTFRFLTAYLATKKDKEFILTGTSRLKERPIKELVEVLKMLGADIGYLEKEDLPPLKIKGKKLIGGEISIDSNISSQFISSLLMIAPTLQKGLTLTIEKEIVSKPYIQMTLTLMSEYGITYNWTGNTIKISPQKYTAKNFNIESDWSAAAFWFEIAALSSKCRIVLHGLHKNSLQGDSDVINLFANLGVISNFQDNSLILQRKEHAQTIDEINLINTPDLYQPLKCTLFALNRNVKFTGIQTLKHKETNRKVAIDNELRKLRIKSSINTYNDHRMAMSFAPLTLKFKEIQINNIEVVSKSYPNFWNDLEKGGFIISPSTD